MKQALLTFFMICLSLNLSAQPHKEAGPATDTFVEVSDDEPYLYVEQQPEFPGGSDSMMAYIKRNVIYPALAKEQGIQGKVFVTFVVGEDGHVREVKIARSPNAVLNQAALDVFNGMPKWKPGKQNGKAVKVRFMVPVSFNLY